VCIVVETWRVLLNVLADDSSEEGDCEVVMAVLVWEGKYFGEVCEVSRENGIG